MSKTKSGLILIKGDANEKIARRFGFYKLDNFYFKGRIRCYDFFEDQNALYEIEDNFSIEEAKSYLSILIPLHNYYNGVTENGICKASKQPWKKFELSKLHIHSELKAEALHKMILKEEETKLRKELKRIPTAPNN